MLISQVKSNEVNRTYNTLSSHKTSLAIILICLLISSTVLSQTVIYDSPAQNYVTGISGLLITGTSNDGIYDVSFSEGSFNAVFGAAAMTTDLAFQTSSDGNTANSIINTFLNTVTPNGPVASLTNATPGSGSFSDLYMIATGATATYAASLASRDLTAVWSVGGNLGVGDRNTLFAPGICGTCIAKWAQFNLTGPILAPVVVPTLQFAWLILLALLLIGITIFTRKLIAK